MSDVTDRFSNGQNEDLLISRVVDRHDAEGDWRGLDRIAAADSRVWQRLAGGLRDDCRVRAVVAGAVAIADRVDAPVPPFSRRRSMLRHRFSWSGWLAAAVIVSLWIADSRSRRGEADGTPPAQLATGVGELPSLVVETKPAADGRGYEITYLRRVLEKRVVPELYELGENEHGRPTTRPAQLTRFTPPESF